MRTISGALAAVVLCVVLGNPSGANAQAPSQNLQMAAVVEWTLANCPQAELPLQALAIASAVANGSETEQMEAARSFVRRQIGAQFKSVEEACLAMQGSFSSP